MKTEKQKIGYEFEKRVFKYLKNNFSKVKWLSQKNHQSTYDFKIEINGKVCFVESKYLSKGKPILRKSQFNADFVAMNDRDGIRLIPNKNFSKFLKLFEGEKSRKYVKAEYGKGIIKKWAGTHIILLNKQWLRDKNLKEGDYVDISQLKKENKK